MSEQDFFNYLTLALKNLGSAKALAFNIENEIKRLLKIYSTDEVINKLQNKK
ncbi:hypothetical protein IW492_11510 [Enterococcus sp. BWB1-3]|uniref:hypothetical protein n=1 Tax=Enterococcus sp. BWB1-3 TaxID=2787713 RepID=UPI001923F5FF|nr:hypothetical protein [Enterococcus sp. BWB1-3]MBL1229858.1 hypothetical protein [Enterococcus sp. BWB1-3]